MPFTQIVYVRPELSRAQEARDILLERANVKDGGATAGVLARMFSTEGPGLVIARRFKDLATLQTIVKGWETDSAFQAFGAKLAPTLAAPLEIQIREPLLPMPDGGPTGVTVSAGFYPLPGKPFDMRRILEDRVRSAQARGEFVALSTIVFNDELPAFYINSAFADLDAYEESRARNLADKGFRDFAAKLSGVAARPARVRVFEILKPFGS